MTSFNGKENFEKSKNYALIFFIFTFWIDYLNQVVGNGWILILLLFNRNLLSRHSFCMNSSNCINIIISIYNPNQTLNHENFALCNEHMKTYITWFLIPNVFSWACSKLALKALAIIGIKPYQNFIHRHLRSACARI